MKENRNIAKVNKTRGWLFANINKIDSTSARLTKKKKFKLLQSEMKVQTLLPKLLKYKWS